MLFPDGEMEGERRGGSEGREALVLAGSACQWAVDSTAAMGSFRGKIHMGDAMSSQQLGRFNTSKSGSKRVVKI